MSTKLIRVPSETYDALKVMSTKHNTTMANLLQFAVSGYLRSFLSNYTNYKYSHSETLDLIECLLQRKEGHDQN